MTHWPVAQLAVWHGGLGLVQFRPSTHMKSTHRRHTPGWAGQLLALQQSPDRSVPPQQTWPGKAGPSGRTVFLQPVVAKQASLVQGLPSSQVFSGKLQPVAGSHALIVHARLSSHTVCTSTQRPPEQV
jgi:hypothetical protein